MHLDLIQSISLCGDATTPNDDRAGTFGARAWVIDGATDLGPPGLMGGQGGAAWLAGAADAAFGAVDAPDLRAACTQVFDTVAARFMTERRRDPVAEWELPSAAFAAVQVRDGMLDAAWAADCAILHAAADGVRWITPSPDRARESAQAAALGDGVGAQKLRSPAVLEDRRAARSRAGRRVLGIDPVASAASVSFAAVPVSPGDGVLLMSDGFSALVDAYAAYDATGLFATLETEGLAALAVILRSIERSDAACTRFPRFKASDDATAIWLRIAA